VQPGRPLIRQSRSVVVSISTVCGFDMISGRMPVQVLPVLSFVFRCLFLRTTATHCCAVDAAPSHALPGLALKLRQAPLLRTFDAQVMPSRAQPRRAQPRLAPLPCPASQIRPSAFRLLPSGNRHRAAHRRRRTRSFQPCFPAAAWPCVQACVWILRRPLNISRPYFSVCYAPDGRRYRVAGVTTVCSPFWSGPRLPDLINSSLMLLC
jgi:hypothetical protein